MFKRVLAVLLAVSLLLVCGISGLVLPTAAATDLLGGTGDFEGNLTKHWQWDSKYSFLHAEKSTVKLAEEADGNHYLEFPTGVKDKFIYKAPITNDKTYRLTLRYKGTGMYLYIHDTIFVSATPNLKTVNLPAATEWTEYTCSFTARSSDNPITATNTAIGIGTKTTEGSGGCIDDVKLFEVVQPTGIAFAQNSVTLSKGQTKALSISAQPDGAEVTGVTYQSNNPAVATVDANGVVTAVKDGLAYITATAGTLTATCAVVVETSPITELVVDGDFQAETLATNWEKFVAATAVSSRAQDPADQSNYCLKFGAQGMYNYSKLGIKANTYYSLTFRYKGTGKARFSFTEKYVLGESLAVSGVDDYSIVLTTSADGHNNVYLTATSEWQTATILFKISGTAQTNWTLQIGAYGTSPVIYYDDMSVVKVGTAYSGVTVGGSLTLNSEEANGSLLNDVMDKPVTVTVAPMEGYLMVPGSLRYMTSNGKVKRILNKAEGDFGEGNGNTFAFTMPKDNVRVLADFVSAEETDFAWGTIGTAVRYKENGDTDGIRFLTRINMQAFDAAGDALTFKYEGETYTVKELGQMLKRATNETELTVENAAQYATAASAERIWSAKAYTAATNAFRLIDYTENYVDHTIVMTTSNPSEEFNSRVYTARGYIILEKDGEEVVLYAEQRSDSVNTAIARANGEIDEEYVGGELPEVPVVPEEPEIVIPSDDKDYTNADLKVLSIGNSYSQDAQNYIAKIAASQGKLFKMVNLYKGGCALKKHAEAWANNEAIYDYELNGVHDDNLADVTLKAVLQSDTFDVITLQSSSYASVNYVNYQPYLNNLIAAIREYQPNAKFYIHQTWAYHDASTNHDNKTGGTMDAMWAKVEAAYNQAAAETGLSLIPTGKAVQYIQPKLEDGGYSESSIQRDNSSHLTYTWGRYMAGRLWYQMLTGDIPNVTLDQIKSSVTADAAMEALVAEAIAAAFEAYPVDPIIYSQ